MDARLARGSRLSGSMSLGRIATNTCGVVDSPQDLLFCAVTPPVQGSRYVKFSAQLDF